MTHSLSQQPSSISLVKPQFKNPLRAFPTVLTQMLDQALDRLLTQQVQEPVVSELKDSQGECYYQVYDPRTEKQYYFTSQEAAIVWLEQRHNQ